MPPAISGAKPAQIVSVFSHLPDPQVHTSAASPVASSTWQKTAARAWAA